MLDRHRDQCYNVDMRGRDVTFLSRFYFHSTDFLIMQIQDKTHNDAVVDSIFKIVERFNFERIEKIMLAADWKWGRPDGLRTPTIDEMKNHCITLMIRAERDQTTVGSGGFYAEFEILDDGRKAISLSFIAAETYEIY